MGVAACVVVVAVGDVVFSVAAFDVFLFMLVMLFLLLFLMSLRLRLLLVLLWNILLVERICHLS